MKIGEFYLEHYDDFWSSKNPVEDFRADSLPCVTIEKLSSGYHKAVVMGGKWCEEELFKCCGSFASCCTNLRQWCDNIYR